MTRMRLPNHVTNRIRVFGDEAEILRMLEEIRQEGAGIGSVDFNKVIPSILKKPESPKSRIRTVHAQVLQTFPPVTCITDLAGIEHIVIQPVCKPEGPLPHKSGEMTSLWSFLSAPCLNQVLDGAFMAPALGLF